MSLVLSLGWFLTGAICALCLIFHTYAKTPRGKVVSGGLALASLALMFTWRLVT